MPIADFVHGKDVTIPKGTEVTAFVNGNMPLDLSRFQAAATPGTVTAAIPATATELSLSSTPAGGDISVDGNFVGNTPSTVSLSPGQHAISIALPGYQPWQRNLQTTGGKVNLSATLIKTESNGISSPSTGEISLADAARAAKAKREAARQSQDSQSPQN